MARPLILRRIRVWLLLQNPDGTEKEAQTEEQITNDPLELRRFGAF